MSDAEDGLPIPPHLGGEFTAWLWWRSEVQGPTFDLGGQVGRVEVWIDERLAFRNPNDTRIAAVMTGENPSVSLEARAALAGGKVLQELRIGLRRDDREYRVTLKGPAMHFAAVKLPQMVTEGGEEVLYDRMHLYEEISMIVAALLRDYAELRVSDDWDGRALPRLREWVMGRAG